MRGSDHLLVQRLFLNKLIIFKLILEREINYDDMHSVCASFIINSEEMCRRF